MQIQLDFDFITRGDDHLYKRTLYGKIMEIKVENRELSLKSRHIHRRLIRLGYAKSKSFSSVKYSFKPI